MVVYYCTYVCIVLYGVCVYLVSPVEGGECCRAFYTESEREEAVWCSKYCCLSDGDGKPYCCNDGAKRAGEGNKSSFCRQWFSAPENVYVTYTHHHQIFVLSEEFKHILPVRRDNITKNHYRNILSLSQ